MPPPMTRVFGVVSTTIGSRGSVRRVRAIPAWTRPMALLVAPSGSSLWIQEHCSRMLTCEYSYGLSPARVATPRNVYVCSLGEQDGHHQAVELVLRDVVDHVLLRGVRAGEHGRPRHGHVAVGLDGLDDLRDVDVVGDVAAAVADVDPDPPRAGGGAVELRLVHAGTPTFSRRARSRCAATWAAVDPACRIESAMSLAPEAAPAT